MSCFVPLYMHNHTCILIHTSTHTPSIHLSSHLYPPPPPPRLTSPIPSNLPSSRRTQRTQRPGTLRSAPVFKISRSQVRSVCLIHARTHVHTYRVVMYTYVQGCTYKGAHTRAHGWIMYIQYTGYMGRCMRAYVRACRAGPRCFGGLYT